MHTLFISPSLPAFLEFHKVLEMQTKPRGDRHPPVSAVKPLSEGWGNLGQTYCEHQCCQLLGL